MIKNELQILCKISNEIEPESVTLNDKQQSKLNAILSACHYPLADLYKDVAFADTIYFNEGEFDNNGTIKTLKPPMVVDQDGTSRYLVARVFIHMQPIKGTLNECYAFDLETIDALMRVLSNALTCECLVIGVGGKDIGSMFYNHGSNLFGVIDDLQTGRVNSSHVKVTSTKKILLVSYDISNITEQSSASGYDMERYITWLGHFRACNDYFDFAGINYKVIKGLSDWLFEKTTIAENDMLDKSIGEMKLHRQTYGVIPQSEETQVKITEYEADWFGTCITMFVYSETDEQHNAIDIYQHVRLSDSEHVDNVIQRVSQNYLHVTRETLCLEDNHQDLRHIMDEIVPLLTSQQRLK